MNRPVAAFSLQQGSEVSFKGRRCVITHILDLDSVLVADAETKQVERASIADLQPAEPTAGVSPTPDLALIPDEDWRIAQQRLEIVRPLLAVRGRTREDVANRADEFGLHSNTLYKWMALYETTGRLTSLMPRSRSDKGTSKLTPEVEAIVAAAIEGEYLTSQRKPVQKVCDEIRRRCLNAGLEPPHCNTVRKRISKLSEKLRLSRRVGQKAAEQAYSPVEGAFPGADWPLAVVQIDHTKLDIMLVDDIHRMSIGRPWITLAIDVFSRMVAGFYVSFDPPGALSTGLCLAHAILPKEKWLAKREIDGEWPCWGLPKTLHLDNAKEFRGNVLQKACREYGIDIEWRPVARPHFGGHIERLLGTLLREIHTLPGTTFSNPSERGDYDSEGKAVLTLSEFETWLGTYIVQVYHRRSHSSLGMPPIEKYREGVFGTSARPGVGLPARIADEDRLRLDFMPFEERTVQDYGVVIDEIHYYHDVLRRWINAAEPTNPKVKRKFTFRRDPRDISAIWFYDPELRAYYPIPYRDTSHPAISVWELREAKRIVSDANGKEIDERSIFSAYERMREIEAQAQAKTKSARRAAQRRKTGLEAPGPTARGAAPLPTPEGAAALPDIAPFDEMDDLSK